MNRRGFLIWGALLLLFSMLLSGCAAPTPEVVEKVVKETVVVHKVVKEAVEVEIEVTRVVEVTPGPTNTATPTATPSPTATMSAVERKWATEVAELMVEVIALGDKVTDLETQATEEAQKATPTLVKIPVRLEDEGGSNAVPIQDRVTVKVVATGVPAPILGRDTRTYRTEFVQGAKLEDELEHMKGMTLVWLDASMNVISVHAALSEWGETGAVPARAEYVRLAGDDNGNPWFSRAYRVENTNVIDGDTIPLKDTGETVLVVSRPEKSTKPVATRKPTPVPPP